MKRCSSIFTRLMMSASLVALTACDEPRVDASIYESVAQCKRDPLASIDQCESNYKEARAQHAAVAPKYASKEECIADFGENKCEEAPYRTSGGG